MIIHESQPKLAIHETESLIGGLEALLEIERDSAALDALISLVELSNEEILRDNQSISRRFTFVR